MKSSFLTRVFAVSLALCPLSALAETADEDLSILIAEAVKQNPSVESMRDRTRELGELADIANTWQDARFAVEYMNAPVNSFSIKNHPMSGVQFSLQQRLPSWGWTRAAREVAEHGVERSRHARAEAEVQLGRSVETLYWSLALSRQLRSVTEKHIGLTVELIRAVQVRYEVGKVGQNALLRLDVLRERLQDDLGDYERADRRFSAGLARVLSRDPNSNFETPTEVTALRPTGELADWIEEALRFRPELAAMQEEIKQREKAAKLSRIGVRPEVDVWVKYRLRVAESPVDDGTDFFSAGVSIPIPWGSAKRGLGGQAAELAARDGARSRLAAAIDEIEAELVDVEASWRRAADKAAAYRERLIPSAESALETTLSDFSVDKAEFSTLYEAQVDLLVLERSYLDATVETRIQRAIARAVTGLRDLGDPS